MHIHNKYFTDYGSCSTDRPNESLLKIMIVLQITNVRYGLIIVYYWDRMVDPEGESCAPYTLNKSVKWTLKVTYVRKLYYI